MGYADVNYRILNVTDIIIENGELQACLRADCGEFSSNAHKAQKSLAATDDDNNPLSFVVICSQIDLYRDNMCLAGLQILIYAPWLVYTIKKIGMIYTITM